VPLAAAAEVRLEVAELRREHETELRKSISKAANATAAEVRVELAELRQEQEAASAVRLREAMDALENQLADLLVKEHQQNEELLQMNEDLLVKDREKHDREVRDIRARFGAVCGEIDEMQSKTYTVVAELQREMSDAQQEMQAHNITALKAEVLELRERVYALTMRPSKFEDGKPQLRRSSSKDSLQGSISSFFGWQGSRECS